VHKTIRITPGARARKKRARTGTQERRARKRGRRLKGAQAWAIVSSIRFCKNVEGLSVVPRRKLGEKLAQESINVVKHPLGPNFVIVGPVLAVTVSFEGEAKA
jgi:hypothetical protein